MITVLVITQVLSLIIFIAFAIALKRDGDFWMKMYKDLRKTTEEAISTNHDLVDKWKESVDLSERLISISKEVSNNADDILESNKRLIEMLKNEKEINEDNTQ